MRFRVSCIAAVVPVLFAGSALSAQAFEGRITLRMMPDDGKPQEMQFQAKGGKVRIETGGKEGGAMIMDPANKKVLMMMPSEKMYMEVALPEGAAAKAAADVKTPDITRTGRTEVIAGYKCEHWLIKGDDGKEVDACIAQGLGNFFNPAAASPMGGRRGSDWSSKVGADGFPLKVIQGGKTQLEVTKVEKVSLDPSLFTPPAGWERMQMPTIPGMGGMRPPG